VASSVFIFGAARLSDKLATSFTICGFIAAALALLPGVFANNPVTALACLTFTLGGLESTVAVSWAICLSTSMGTTADSGRRVLGRYGRLPGDVAGLDIAVPDG
jgi:hypothetical protein